MSNKAWQVLFLGSGTTTDENVNGLLADWMSEDNEYTNPVFPEKIGRSDIGLKKCLAWVQKEFGEENIVTTTDFVSVADPDKYDVKVVCISDAEDTTLQDTLYALIKKGAAVHDLRAGLYQLTTDHFIPEIRAEEPPWEPEPAEEDHAKEMPAPVEDEPTRAVPVGTMFTYQILPDSPLTPNLAQDVLTLVERIMREARR